RRAYAHAATVGASVPAAHEALGELEYAELVMELYGRGDVEPDFERGAAAAGRALAVLPDHYPSLVLLARLDRRFAQHRQNHGVAVEDLLAPAVAWAQRAL